MSKSATPPKGIHNRDMYITPAPIIRKMIAGLRTEFRDNESKTLYILDPAAGTGAILDAIQSKFKDGYGVKPALYACEIVEDLVATLEGKGYPVMARDFLTYQPTLKFTHIIMNPPFSLAAKFIVHAWEILAEGGTLVSVLPASIKKQNDTNEFQAMRLITDFGKVEDLGSPFKSAERATDEPCILVTLAKNTSGAKLDFDVDNDYTDKQYEQVFTAPEMAMMPTGFIAKKLACYNAALQEFANYRASHRKMVALLEEFEHDFRYGTDGDRGRHRDETILTAAQSQMDDRSAFNAFYTYTTEAAWNGILEHPEFQRAMTTQAKKMIDNFRRSRNRVDFNEANIKSMFMALVAKSDDLLKQCVFDAFDTLTQFHWGNRCHVEGWKHNSRWMVSPHCIVPYGMDTRFGGSPSLRYYDELNDIDKGLCTLMKLPVDALNVYKCPHCNEDRHITFFGWDERNFETMKPNRAVCGKCKGEFPYLRGIVETIRNRENYNSWGQLCLSHFFEIRYFKKGTIHLRFRDKAVWQKLNYTASKLRGWLPDGVQPWHVVWKPKRKAKPDPYKGYNPIYSGDKDDRASDEFTIEIDLRLPEPRTNTGDKKAPARRNGNGHDSTAQESPQAELALVME